MLKVDPRPSATITKIQKTDLGLKLISERGTLLLTVYTDEIVRVMYTVEGDPCPALPEYFCCEPSAVKWDVVESEKEISLVTSKLCLSVDRKTASLTYKDAQGNVVLRERESDSRTMESFVSTKTIVDENTIVKEVNTADGIKRFIEEATTVPDKTLYRTRLNLRFSDGEALYGLGQHEEGSLNLRGTTQYLHQANMKIAIPFLLSDLGWGILLTGGSPAIFNDTTYGSYLYTHADPQMDYFFIYSGSMKGVTQGYRHLTGKAAMLPSWAVGYVQSQERYETQQEILDIAAQYHRRGIGLDLIVLDWDSWVPGHWGQKTFDKARFWNAKDMIDTLHRDGVHFMISIWPNMAQESDNYKEFFDANLLLPASEIYDALNPDARALYWKQSSEGLFSHGVDSWWCDSSEPLTPEWARMEKPEPAEMFCEFYDTAAKYIPAEQCNAYGVYHAKTMWEGQRGETQKKRVCVLTRNGYTGQQSMGSIVWSGDISGNWETLKNQIPAGLNMSVSGLPFWTLDSGAFFVAKGEKWFWNGDYDNGWDDLGYCELSVRWLQYATFLPIMRGHGTDVRREFWKSGEVGTPFYDAMVAANRLRYRLIPYIYSAFGNVWLNDDVIIKPLIYDFPHDKKVQNIADEFMFGDSILVCPVITPMYYDKGEKLPDDLPKQRDIYLPSGCDWFDYHSGKRYSGGNTITVEAPLERIPVFVKEGSIIPHSGNNEALTVGDALRYPLMFKVYGTIDAEYDYYEDAGDGYGYEKGEYRVTTLSFDAASKTLSIKSQQGNKTMFDSLRFDVEIVEG